MTNYIKVFSRYYIEILLVDMIIFRNIFLCHIIVLLYKAYDNPKIMQSSGGSGWRVTISNNDLLKPRPTCWENQASRVVAKTTPKTRERRSFFISHIIYFIIGIQVDYGGQMFQTVAASNIVWFSHKIVEYVETNHILSKLW